MFVVIELDGEPDIQVPFDDKSFAVSFIKEIVAVGGYLNYHKGFFYPLHLIRKMYISETAQVQVANAPQAPPALVVVPPVVEKVVVEPPERKVTTIRPKKGRFAA